MAKLPGGAPMVTAALFAIARRWKHPRGPSVDEWMNRYGTSIQWNGIQPKKGGKFDPRDMSEP